MKSWQIEGVTNERAVLSWGMGMGAMVEGSAKEAKSNEEEEKWSCRRRADVFDQGRMEKGRGARKLKSVSENKVV